MPVVTFLSGDPPDGANPASPTVVTRDALPGSLLMDAIREAGPPMDWPCGGRGTCGRCIVRIASGGALADCAGLLSRDALDAGYVLACRARVRNEPLTVEIPQRTAQGAGQFVEEADEGCAPGARLLPGDVLPEPIAARRLLHVPAPRLQDGLSDVDRLERAAGARLDLPLALLRKLADAPRTDGGSVTVSVAGERAVNVGAGDRVADGLGLAVDIGTTTVAVQLIDLQSATVRATRTAYNEQIACGLDVISRINFARKPQGLEELRSRVLRTVNSLTAQVCARPADVDVVVIAGNTTMIHLLLGLPPEHIRLAPYTPTVMAPTGLSAVEIDLEVNPAAAVFVAPAAGSYVGGDITAGLLCTDLPEAAEPELFMDLGTNGEVVVGNREFLLSCACSAGPAFEGGGIRHGMRAALGAIDRVTVDPGSGAPTIRVIGDARPRGICGSGMISLVAELFVGGLLDGAGKLDRSGRYPAIRQEGRQAVCGVAPAHTSELGIPIEVSETDIQNVMRAKAAVYCACALMLGEVGLSFGDLARVHIAGGFGRFMDVEEAIAIGLLPDLPRERFHYLGNASLRGAALALVSALARRRLGDLTRRMTYVELSTDPAYMKQYTGALFLPHTDAVAFPTVRRRVS